PYILIKEEEEEEEEEDVEIRDTDHLLLATKTEDDISHLEVYVYEPEDHNLYVHHDIMLPSFPLCVEWIGYSFDETKPFGNMAAVGTLDPEIEIWNLDVLDVMFPQAILGESKKSKKSKKSKSRHVDSVLSLSWNANHSNVLASGSADKTVKLWDLSSQTAVASLDYHKDKVQAVQWNEKQSAILLTGSYDKTAVCADVRDVESKTQPTWNLPADVECLKWNPFDENKFLVSLENGHVMYADVRQPGQFIFTLNAHDDKPVSALDWNYKLPNIFITGAVDKTVKIWDLATGSPSCIDSKDLEVGKVFASSFCCDSPFLFAAGGNKGKIKVMDLLNVNSTRPIFQEKAKEMNIPIPERPIHDQMNSMELDSSSDESHDEIGH
ncbi:hypothetical protein O9G_006015, partial [Rozella allomycis CSF55]